MFSFRSNILAPAEQNPRADLNRDICPRLFAVCFPISVDKYSRSDYTLLRLNNPTIEKSLASYHTRHIFGRVLNAQHSLANRNHAELPFWDSSRLPPNLLQPSLQKSLGPNPPMVRQCVAAVFGTVGFGHQENFLRVRKFGHSDLLAAD